MYIYIERYMWWLCEFLPIASAMSASSLSTSAALKASVRASVSPSQENNPVWKSAKVSQHGSIHSRNEKYSTYGLQNALTNVLKGNESYVYIHTVISV